MTEVRERPLRRPRGLYRSVPRFTHLSDNRRETLSVRNFIRALTRFQPRQDSWQSEIPFIQSRVTEEFRRLHRRDNADFILSPRSPHSEFRPKSAYPDCKKEYVPKTNICFGTPELRVSRRCIRSAPPAAQRSESVGTSLRSSGRFEHNILQDEYFELRSMLTQPGQPRSTLEDLVSRPAGVYSHQNPSTNHRIFCMEEAVGMQYFKRFRNDLLVNLTLDMDNIRTRRETGDEDNPDKIETAGAENNHPKNKASEKLEPKLSARSAISIATSVSSFNSEGEVQTGKGKPRTSVQQDDTVPTVPPEGDVVTTASKDVSTSTTDDRCVDNRLG